LFTQCSKCETVFKLSAEVLRAASGQVRCGNCGDVFNALARLAEDSTAFAAGESPLELEVRADSILEAMVTPQITQEVAKDYEEFAAPGVEIARLEVDWTEEDQAQNADAPDGEDADCSMEFTLPPGELDRIFIESKKQTQQPRSPAPTPTSITAPTPVRAPTPAPVPAPAPAQQPMSVPRPASGQQPASAQQSASVRPPRPPQPLAPSPQPVPMPPRVSAQQPEAFEEFDPGARSDSEPPPHPESVAAEADLFSKRAGGFEVPEEVRREMLAEFEQHIQPASLARNSGRRNARRPRPALWLAAAVVSALLLAGQIVHQNREWFVAHAHGPWGDAVRALYGALGAPLPAPANLSAYELRQWGVTGDPDANGTLRVRASILNTAAQLQPYPLLRVTLADRFGKNIGRRDFEPSEYLGRPTAKLLAPGERVDATLTILDPGKDAEGFEIDVCLRGVEQRISCANDVAPQAKR
jgi:predicted Zn finger-like uncharacterized protein